MAHNEVVPQSTSGVTSVKMRISRGQQGYRPFSENGESEG